MNKQMTAADVVAQLEDGMTIGIGGWGPRRKPMALVREILRSTLKDLTIVSYDSADERESWSRSLRLLMDEVLPRCQTSSLSMAGSREGGLS